MKIRAQQCLTFPSSPMFGKGGGSSPAQQVSTHCRRARALITAWGPGATLTLTPTPYQEQCSGRDLRGFPQARLPSSFNHTNISLIYGPSVQRASDWSLRSINFGDGCIHPLGHTRPRGRGQGMCPGHAPGIRCLWILFYHFPIRRRRNMPPDLGYDPLNMSRWIERGPGPLSLNYKAF